MEFVTLYFAHHCIFTDILCPVRDKVVEVRVPVTEGTYVYPEVRCAQSHNILRPLERR